MSDDYRVERLEIIPYRLPLKRPWVTATGSMTARRGFIVRLRTAEGLIGYGDCAPFVEAGTETLAQAEGRLLEICRNSSRCTLSLLLEYLRETGDRPATCFAVESAALDVYSQGDGLPLSLHLSPAAASAVQVNANVGALDSGVVQRCLDAVQAGYRVIKVKAGRDNVIKEINDLYNIFDKLDKEYKKILFRIDVNRAWSEEEAKYAVEALQNRPIDCFEEPLQDPDWHTLSRLQHVSPWPIAIDESISLGSREELIANPPTRRVVCKPAVLGGLRGTLEFATALQTCDTEVLVTTTLESAAGTWACTHLAAALNSHLAHGLGTSGWFAVDTGIPPQIRAGRIDMPSTPGLGFVGRDP